MKEPFDDMNDVQIISSILFADKRPDIPPETPPKYSELIRKCWSRNTEDRPSIPQILKVTPTCHGALAEILQEIQGMMNDLKEEREISGTTTICKLQLLTFSQPRPRPRPAAALVWMTLLLCME
jgi:hypothetical protein